MGSDHDTEDTNPIIDEENPTTTVRKSSVIGFCEALIANYTWTNNKHGIKVDGSERSTFVRRNRVMDIIFTGK